MPVGLLAWATCSWRALQHTTARYSAAQHSVSSSGFRSAFAGRAGHAAAQGAQSPSGHPACLRAQLLNRESRLCWVLDEIKRAALGLPVVAQLNCGQGVAGAGGSPCRVLCKRRQQLAHRLLQACAALRPGSQTHRYTAPLASGAHPACCPGCRWVGLWLPLQPQQCWRRAAAAQPAPALQAAATRRVRFSSSFSCTPGLKDSAAVGNLRASLTQSRPLLQADQKHCTRRTHEEQVRRSSDGGRMAARNAVSPSSRGSWDSHLAALPV